MNLRVDKYMIQIIKTWILYDEEVDVMYYMRIKKTSHRISIRKIHEVNLTLSILLQLVKQ